MTQQRKIGIGVVAVAVVALVLYVWIGRGYGEISNHGYQYATALYSCCNQKDSDRLEKISQMLKDDTQKQKLSSDESIWMTQIIVLAQSGDWDGASNKVRALMNAQIKRAS